MSNTTLNVVKHNNSIVIDDKCLVKILRYLDLKQKSRIALTSKQFSKCFDRLLETKRRFTLWTCHPMMDAMDMKDKGQDFLIIRTKDLNSDHKLYHRMAIDVKSDIKKYESLLKKLKNLRTIDFWFAECSEELVEWLAKAFNNEDLSVRIRYMNKAHELCPHIQKHFGSRVTEWRIASIEFGQMNLGQFDNLEVLDIYGYGRQSLLSIASRIPPLLETLQVSTNMMVTVGSMRWSKPLNNFKNIRRLVIKTEDCDGLKVIANHFPSLIWLNASVDCKPRLKSLKSLSRHPLNVLTLHFRETTARLCFKTFFEAGIVMEKVGTLAIGGDYVLKSLQFVVHCFPSLRRLHLYDLKIHCKYSCDDLKQNQLLCFECIHSQIKDLALVSQMRPSLTEINVQLWSDIDFVKHYRLLLRALFEVYVDCEHSFRIILTTRRKKTIIDVVLDLILFATRSPLKAIQYMIGSAVFQYVHKYANIFPAKASVTSIGSRQSVTDLKCEPTIICCTIATGYSCELLAKNSSKVINIKICL